MTDEDKFDRSKLVATLAATLVAGDMLRPHEVCKYRNERDEILFRVAVEDADQLLDEAWDYLEEVDVRIKTRQEKA